MKRFNLAALVFWIVSGFHISGIGQSSITFEYSPAKFVQHSNRATFETPNFSYLLGFQWRIDPYWDRPWQTFWNNPEVKLHFVYIDYGNPKLLGQGYGFFPSIGFNIKQNQKFRFNFRIGSGIIYITQKYQKLDNPNNSAIGSNLNNITQLAFGNKFTLSSSIDLHADLHLTHASNASTTTPNSGVNLVGLSIGMTKKFGEMTKNDIELSDTVRYKKWFFDGHYGYGISEYSYTGGPKFSADIISFGLGYRLNPYVQVFVGGEYEFKRSVYQFYYHDFETRETARSFATRYSVFGAGQMNFGLISLRGQCGFYILKEAILIDTHPYYFKLSSLFYPLPKKCPIQPYLGVQLKSHGAVAQYLALLAGITFP
ncbi:MAG: acyloxyacyl hydrolase [Saprospiraceae bacterium]